MNMKGLVRSARHVAPRYRHRGEELVSLQNDINRLFDGFLGGWDLPAFKAMEDRLVEFTPRIDVKETDREVQVTAELPGMDENDVSVSLEEDALLIRGEKKDEHEEKTAHTFHLERSFGSFQRVIPLPSTVEAAKTRAVFKKGILRVILPKAAGERAKIRKIEVKTG